ncbi:hypothetical protein G195_000351 [Phytophthora kernoviae 00238/432]|uniref:subtilisin n=1 Tax=Phytophthora kernoviae 00238/432 TaxID=1284355 RepID=A0A8J4SXC7_9STRA|nr:hypothetical protein G195_000351 [Phytophthora kernoviae 00238/432]
MGTMVGSEANGTNKIGVAPGAKWIAVRIFNPSTTDAIILDGGQWLIAPVDADGNLHPELAPDVVNNSWGGGPGLDEWFRPMVQAWRDAQIFPEFSAGNVTLTNPGGPVEAFAKTTGTSQYVYLPMNRIAGDAKDGTYTATIPAFLIESQGLEYYIRVNDYGNNGFESEVYKVAVSNGVQPGYLQDFEEDNLGFTSGGVGNTWAWGAPTSGPGSAYSGDKLIATNLTGTYAANSNAYLLAPPIDLTQSPEGALLSFKHWYDLESNIDFGKVYIATEDSDYAFEEALSFTGAGGGWKTQYIDLRDYAGQQVFIKFNLTSDNSVQKAGWYIDDFSVQAPDDIAPGAPSGLSATADILGNVNLSWTGSDDEDLESYNVYRSTNPGSAALDYSGNESDKSNEVSVTVEVPEDIFIDHFDGNSDNGWSHSGTKDEWERGVPVVGPASAVSPPNVWATDLDSTYENGSNYSLVSPVVDLTQVDQATLTFNHWYEIESGYDYGYVEATKDGGNTWSELGKFSHSSNGKQWTPVFYDLAALKGNEVQFRFRLTSDSSVVKQGWYIDDFRILGIAAETVTKDTAVVLSSDKPKPEYDNPWYKVSSTDKAEFNKTKQEQPEVQKPGTGSVTPQSLPASATVTVLETGRSVKTDPTTGKYSFTHVAGDYTLKAEAYGYYPQTKTVTITDGSGATANFNLETIPQGKIEGTVSDERTGKPLAGASVLVLEDAQVGAVRTGTDGKFILDVLEGSYTLSIIATDYYSKTHSSQVHHFDSGIHSGQYPAEQHSNMPFMTPPDQVERQADCWRGHSTDVRIVAGETVTVSFDSKPKLQGSFRIELPSNLTPQAGGEIPLVETEPGHYTGTYTTPASLVLEGGVIVIRAQDAAGNKVEVEAPGRLFVSAAEAPVTNVPSDDDNLLPGTQIE